MNVHIIGAGHLGKTLGRLLVLHKLATIKGVVNQRMKHALKSVQWIGEGQAFTDITSLPSADLFFITTPDFELPTVCRALLTNKHQKPGSVIAHCSGSLTSDILAPLKTLGFHIASIHPMHSFADPLLSVSTFPGTYCAFEGDEAATHVITALFQAMGAITYPIEKEKKTLYHVAGVFASNYLVTLSHEALSCLLEAGVEREIAMKVVVNLMKSTTLNLEKTLSPEQALTGPIQRGEEATINKHLAALLDPNQRNLYQTLRQATLALTTST